MRVSSSIRARGLITHHHDRPEVDERRAIVENSLSELIQQLERLNLPGWDLESR